jgi:hypothetical protein
MALTLLPDLRAEASAEACEAEVADEETFLGVAEKEAVDGLCRPAG